MTMVPQKTVNPPMVPWIEELTPLPDATAWLGCALPHVALLESADRQDERGRYSYVTADPVEWLCYTRDDLSHIDPFAELGSRLSRYPQTRVAGLPPFQGGAIGMFGYELAHHLERLPTPQYDEFRLPVFAIGIYDFVIAIDHTQARAWLMLNGYPHGNESAMRARRAQVFTWLKSPPRATARIATPYVTPCPQSPLPGYPQVTSNFARDAYLQAAQRAIDYIHAGDCFQVNIAQRLLTPTRMDAATLYRQSRERNAAPFAGYLDLGEQQIVSASPERFLRVQDGQVETRPIKGTRRRSDDPIEDQRLIAELLASPKDRAENVMIVDLLRNDLGRVCEFGSIHVPTICTVESYRHVHHLISVVQGRLRPECSAIDLLRASFPGGSVTGAPKVRAMEIIAELEPTARGPYCGALGFLGFNGTMDTNILIRTFTLAGGWTQFPVGGGLVADSDPVSEYEETLHKAEGLLRSLGPPCHSF